MYVMPVPTVLTLDEQRPHQELSVLRSLAHGRIHSVRRDPEADPAGGDVLEERLLAADVTRSEVSKV